MKHIGRKIYHLAGGIGLLSLYYVLGRDRALIFYAGFFLIVLMLDLIRLNVPPLNRFILTKFGSFIRANEEHKLTGTAPYVLGIGLSLYRLDSVLDGDLDEFIEALTAAANAERLKNL